MPDFVRKTPPSTAAAAAPESGSPGRERRAEPRLLSVIGPAPGSCVFQE
jgi:hypothetical protein